MNPLHTPFGTFTIDCDQGGDHSIQGWNQADAYLLQRLAQHPGYNRQALGIINDEWGALSIATQHLGPDIYSDSAIFSDWLHINSGANAAAVKLHNIAALAESAARIFLMRLPKNLHFFQHQLSLLSQLPDITVYVAGMQKYWPATFFHTAAEYFAEMEVYPGSKKAKCMRLRLGKQNSRPEPLYKLDIAEFGLHAINYPNVFSRESLDIGTRFFLQNFPDLADCEHIIDLACGNGLLGIYALQQNHRLAASFIDESFYATCSCTASLQAASIAENRYRVYQNNALHRLELPVADAILCNPPFHQLHRIGDHIASTMISQSAAALKPGGKLYLIGNSHLHYAALLKKDFRTIGKVASNNKFVIYCAQT